MALLYNRFSMYVGMVHIMLPFMILPLYAIMQRIDLRLIAAARSLGAGAVPAFLLVFLPLSLPGVLSGSLLVFIISLGFFVTPALLGGLEEITYVMLIERQVNHLHNWELAAAMAVVLLVVTLLLVAVFQRIVAVRSTAAGAAARTSAWLTQGVTAWLALRARLRGLSARGRGHVPDPGRAGDPAAWVPTGVAWAVVAFLCFPIAILIPLAFSDALFLQFPPPGFSLRWFATYFSRDDWVRPTITSFQVASLTMVGATVIGTLAAIPLVRGGYRWRGVLTAFLLSPLIVPSIILAISVYFFFARLGLVGTIRGLVLAHLVLAVPYVVIVVS